MSNGEYDRISPNPQIDASYAARLANEKVGACFIDERLHASVLNNLFAQHDVDGVYINLCFSQKKLQSVHKETDRWIVEDMCGTRWVVPFDGVGSVIEYRVQDLDDEILYTQNPLEDGIVETFKLIDDEYKRTKAIIPGITGPYSQVVFMVGMENVLIEMLDNGNKLKQAIEARVKFAIDWADKLINAGAKIVWIGEGPASSSVISPSSYAEFVLPYEQRLISHLHSCNVKAILHICGNINQSLPYIIHSGADGFDIDHMVDLDFVHSITKDQYCLKGNINPTELVFSGEAEIFDKAKSIMKNFKKRGLILSTGCLVSRDTPRANIDALIRATLEV